MAEIVVTIAPNVAHSAAAEASHVVRAAPGVLYGLDVYSANVGAQFIQIHDAASVPADTAVPLYCATVGATSNFHVDFGVRGLKCSTGIVVCNSSTAATKTLGAADCLFTARHAGQ